MTQRTLSQSPPSPYQLSFTSGVVVGQASILLLIALFLRYVVFEDGSSGKIKVRFSSLRDREQP